jgi:hypothetical protein
MGLEVKNNRDANVLYFALCLSILWYTRGWEWQGKGSLCMGKKVFHTRFTLLKIW